MRTFTLLAVILTSSALPSPVQNPAGGNDRPDRDTPGKKPVNGTTGQGVTVNGASKAKDQLELATGEDLHGPPRRFPACKTPE
jgi:hypothetical protein